MLIVRYFIIVLKIYNSTNVYAIGITALEMAEGKPPYGDIHPMRVCIVMFNVINN